MDGPQIPPEYAAYPRQYGYPFGRGPAPQRVRFEAISDAWEILKADIGSWVLASLLIFAIAMALEIPLVIAVFPIAMSSRGGDPLALGEQMFWPSLAFTIAIALAIGIANAGVLRMGLLKARGQMADAGAIFRLNGRFWSIAGAESVLALCSTLSMFAGHAATSLFGRSADPFSLQFVTFGGQIVGWVVTATIQTLSTFVPLLLIDRHLGIREAFIKSFSITGRHFFPLAGILIVASILSFLGVVGCGIGILFTMPFYYIIRAIVYNDFFRPDPEPEAPSVSNMVNPPTIGAL